MAKKNIHITTPYFIPDEGLMRALKMAAIEGIEVKIIIPSKANTDNELTWYASIHYLGQLLDAGVQVHLYEKGFIHAKLCVIDNLIASIGTANFDLRSFLLDYEVNIMLYDMPSIADITKQFEIDIKDSRRLEREEYQKRSNQQRIKEKIAVAFSKQM